MSDDLQENRGEEIGVLVHDFALGGAERVAIRLANAWSAMGCRVVVFAGNGGGAQRTLLSNDVRIVIADPPLVRGRRSTPAKLGRWVAANHQGIGTFYLPGNSYFTAIGPLAKAGVPIYATITNSLWRPDRTWLRNVVFAWLTRFRLRKTTGVISMSEALLRQERRLLGNRRNIVALPNALFEEFPENSQKARQHWQLCAVARLVPQKNIALLLRSVAMLTDLPVRLVIAGDGVLRNELQQLANALGVGQRVRFLGAVPSALELMCESEVVVLSSDYEGMPAAAIEAVAVGAFVVSSNCSVGMQDILTSGELGFIVQRQQPADFAEALRGFFAGSGRFAADRRRELAAGLVRAHVAHESARRHLEFMGIAPLAAVEQ